jgi:hypothetical protein
MRSMMVAMVVVLSYGRPDLRLGLAWFSRGRNQAGGEGEVGHRRERQCFGVELPGSQQGQQVHDRDHGDDAGHQQWRFEAPRGEQQTRPGGRQKVVPSG